MLKNQHTIYGRATFLIGGQWGSEGKGATAAWLAANLAKQGKQFDIVTTNAGAQAGHTSVHKGQRRIVYHLPTAPLISREFGLRSMIYLNAGAIIDPELLGKEMEEQSLDYNDVWIHPVAAVIQPEDKVAEEAADSPMTRTGSTRKGVGVALARKIMRGGMVAHQHPFLQKFPQVILDLNQQMLNGKSVLVEVPQGIGLSVNNGAWPHVTSRDCTVQKAASDANIHPHFYGGSILVMRTFPIRVGNIIEEGKENSSGPCFDDQKEISWEEVGVEAEITTVTKRVRRVFTFSHQQLTWAMKITRPNVVVISFADYPNAPVGDIMQRINMEAAHLDMATPTICVQSGPTTEDVSRVHITPAASYLHG